jgi:hypothetical protein
MMEREGKNEETRVLARKIARELTPEELLEAAGATGFSPMASSCLASDNKPCDLDREIQ